ncbi:MAG: class I SAM-dependent methyltransferase family protein [Candidatus Lokiarchaeota archaeon]|nr:class I SAM-dependent methyltransferase family protein [Candidatus Lokiarchaeota archaeon]
MNSKNLNKKEEISFLKLKKTNAQYFIQIIKDQFKDDSIIDQKYKIEHKNNDILFPLVDNKEVIDKLVNAIENHIQFKLVSKEGIYNPNFKYKTLEDALKGKVPPNFLSLIPKSYDIIGNIAILEFEKPDQITNNKFNEVKNLVAEAVIEVNKNVQSVFEKKSEIKGSYRLRDLVYLSGENNLETQHKENNCIFQLDIRKTFFSPRLVYERRRISESDISKNEIIVDMFAGVGPFSIQIAKLNPVEIHAFDLNPAAYGFLKRNISLNKLKGTIFPYNFNIKELISPSNQVGRKLANNVDRIIMNLPENSFDFLDIACFLMKKSGGMLHFYNFLEKPDPIDKIIEDLNRKLIELNWIIGEVIDSKIVKSYSPKADLIVLDLYIKYSNS